MKTVTLTAAAEGFTCVEVDEVRFDLGVAVKDVSDDVVTRLEEMEGFKFEVADGAAGADSGIPSDGTTASEGAGGTTQ